MTYNKNSSPISRRQSEKSSEQIRKDSERNQKEGQREKPSGTEVVGAVEEVRGGTPRYDLVKDEIFRPCDSGSRADALGAGHSTENGMDEGRGTSLSR